MKYLTNIHSVSLRIQSECGKIRTGKTPNTDTFHAVINLRCFNVVCFQCFKKSIKYTSNTEKVTLKQAYGSTVIDLQSYTFLVNLTRQIHKGVKGIEEVQDKLRSTSAGISRDKRGTLRDIITAADKKEIKTERHK